MMVLILLFRARARVCVWIAARVARAASTRAALAHVQRSHRVVCAAQRRAKEFCFAGTQSTHNGGTRAARAHAPRPLFMQPQSPVRAAQCTCKMHERSTRREMRKTFPASANSRRTCTRSTPCSPRHGLGTHSLPCATRVSWCDTVAARRVSWPAHGMRMHAHVPMHAPWPHVRSAEQARRAAHAACIEQHACSVELISNAVSRPW